MLPENRYYLREVGRRTVDLVEHDAQWAAQFADVERELTAALGEIVVGVHHIGSTAVPGLVAKCTIDVALEVRSIAEFMEAIPELEALGFEYRPTSWFDHDHAFLGRIRVDERTHHLHVVAEGYAGVSDWLDFRDWLRANPDAVRRYAVVKRRLAEVHYADRRAYVDGKTAIVEQLLAEARSQRHLGASSSRSRTAGGSGTQRLTASRRVSPDSAQPHRGVR